MINIYITTSYQTDEIGKHKGNVSMQKTKVQLPRLIWREQDLNQAMIKTWRIMTTTKMWVFTDQRWWIITTNNLNALFFKWRINQIHSWVFQWIKRVGDNNSSLQNKEEKSKPGRDLKR
jgi:hypothetical protein